MAPFVVILAILIGISLGSYYWPDNGGTVGLILGVAAANLFLGAPSDWWRTVYRTRHPVSTARAAPPAQNRGEW